MERALKFYHLYLTQNKQTHLERNIRELVIITREEIETYKKINVEFIKDCHRIIKIISKTFPECYGDWSFADTFSLQDEDVYWEGDEYWAYGGHEHHSGVFPADYLAMDDEEIRNIFKVKRQTYIDKKNEDEFKREQKIKEAEYNTYLSLKRKYEGTENPPKLD